jgi:hypothetical protein
LGNISGIFYTEINGTVQHLQIINLADSSVVWESQKDKQCTITLNEARSHNHCCRANAESVEKYKIVFLYA